VGLHICAACCGSLKNLDESSNLKTFVHPGGFNEACRYLAAGLTLILKLPVVQARPVHAFIVEFENPECSCDCLKDYASCVA